MKLNVTQSNLSAFKIDKQLFFFDINKVVPILIKQTNVLKLNGALAYLLLYTIGLKMFVIVSLELLN